MKTSTTGSGQLSLQLTWSCDIACAHCCQDHVKLRLGAELGRRVISGFHQLGLVTRLGFTGGEPFVVYSDLCELARHAAGLGLPFGLVTNGRWATTPARTREKLRPLVETGLDILAVSYDSYHAEFVPPDRVVSLAEIAQEAGVHCLLYVSLGAGPEKEETERLVEGIVERCSIEVRRRPVVPVGHARGRGHDFGFPLATLDASCPIRELCTVWPTGEVLPCGSAGAHARLAVGNVRHEPVEVIAGRLKSSPLHRIIHEEGLLGIVLRLPPERQEKLLKARFVSPCHLCHSLLADPEIAAAIDAMEAERFGPVETALRESALRYRSHAACGASVERSEEFI